MALDLSKLTTKLSRKLAATSESGYVQLKRVTGDSVDPITGVYTPGVPEVIGLNAAVTDMPTNLVDGTRILSTDVKVVIDNLVIPQTDDRLIIGGIEHTFIVISPKNHAGVIQAQFLAARK